MTFSYRLAILTHGDAETFKSTIDSFMATVTPKPADIVAVWDGPTEGATDIGWHMPTHVPYTTLTLPESGFCEATRFLWESASDRKRPEVSHVFWLEHDFEFERRVELSAMAKALDLRPDVAQMSLLRHPEQHEFPSLVTPDWTLRGQPGRHWMEQSRYWTTNPSLIPIGVMRHHQWPDGPGCEGKMTIALREGGGTFGVWGEGDPWIRHTGVRNGHGY